MKKLLTVMLSSLLLFPAYAQESKPTNQENSANKKSEMKLPKKKDDKSKNKSEKAKETKTEVKK